MESKITSVQLYRLATLRMDASDIDHWQTDLYLRETGESRELVECYEFKENVERFRSPIDGKMWFDVPFAYTPGWEKARW